jgi:Rps23 Pro-64 3,4-dihydroxylase Tpa1-like proline 4-hydroxylase
LQRHYPGSKFNYHVDNEGFDGKADGNVIYTTVIYFNDDYNGGLLDFPELNITFKPSKGSLVIFNSSKDYVHGVTEIKKGSTRYA